MKKLFIFFALFCFFSISYADGGHRGKVVSTMDVEGYTYTELENNGKKIWIASPNVELKVGDYIEASAGMLMTDFYSKTLKRTFKEIYFVTYVNPIKDKSENQPKDTKALDITLQELYKNKDKYNGKLVKLQGFITKASPNIMGKNWYHVGDKDKNYDIVVSSADNSDLGDLVSVEGTVTLNKSIGGGYNFPIFIEDGKVISK
ncbi:MAG: hypothetical protein N2999_04355 [Proteobacteria bacterium]|nr:hypothetical protein [Pseudomonadota bacterium]